MRRLMNGKRLVMVGLLVATALMAAACARGAPTTGAPAAIETQATAPATTAAPAATELTTATPAAPAPPVTMTATPAATKATPTTRPASPTAVDTATAKPERQATTGTTRIRLIIGNTVLTGQLWDSATARDLIAQLALTLTFSDYSGQEKLAPLPRKLSMDGVPTGADPLPRDIGYYAPAGVVVFYYSDVGYFNGIVRIGQFDGSLDAITSQTGDFAVRIELAN
ncbi:MAG: hypothetical protein K1X65_05540 [Caldilineales bacterium]|nr:hypothetical protein [Caldilineales bacterium]